MPAGTRTEIQECNCLAVRQAARHITQFYDQCLAMTINALAHELVMDRTTLGRTMLPLERDGLIAVTDGISDRRSKELHLTKAGAGRVRAARKLWAQAQTRFEAAFGGERASILRNELRAVVASELGGALQHRT